MEHAARFLTATIFDARSGAGEIAAGSISSLGRKSFAPHPHPHLLPTLKSTP
jgi:hypothetical protein